MHAWSTRTDIWTTQAARTSQENGRARGGGIGRKSVTPGRDPQEAAYAGNTWSIIAGTLRSPMDPAWVDIVLVRPSRPANVAVACRAMKNMGLRFLRLVEPPAGLDRPEARALAYGGWDVLGAASVL